MELSDSVDAAPAALRGAPVFSVGSYTITWAEVVADARARRTWAEVEQEIAEGTAAPELSVSDAKDRAAEFRYARGLVAGEEMEAWLASWGLTVRQWMRFIRGSVEPGDEWAVAVCSGALTRFATDLAGRLAVHERMQAADPDASMTAFRAEVATDEAMAVLLHARALEWTCIDAELLTFGHDDAAREAVLCLTHDGLAPAQVAATAHVAVDHRVMRLDELEPTLRDALLGARPGDVVGPVSGAVIVVHDRRFPSLDDPAIRRLAEEALIARAVQREVDDRVVWHVDL